MMISELAIWYLFLGGVGGGALFWACVVDLAAGRTRTPEATFDLRPVAVCRITAVVLLAFGAAFLTADLGRIDRIMSLFIHPSLSYISIGAWALVLGMLCALANLAPRLRTGASASSVQPPKRILGLALNILGLALGLLISVYTGLLLRTMVGVALWATPLIPVLFGLSSLAGGLAVLLLCAAATSGQPLFEGPFSRLVMVDVALILGEVLVTILLLTWTFSVENSSMQASRALLFAPTEQAGLFWLGFVGLGLALPLILDVAIIAGSARERARAPKPIAGAAPLYTPARTHGLRLALAALAAAAVLAGALCLRFAVVEAGAQRQLELTDAPAVTFALE